MFCWKLITFEPQLKITGSNRKKKNMYTYTLTNRYPRFGYIVFILNYLNIEGSGRKGRIITKKKKDDTVFTPGTLDIYNKNAKALKPHLVIYCFWLKPLFTQKLRS